MAERILHLQHDYIELEISEFDKDKEVRVDYSGVEGDLFFYLNRDELCQIKQHIEYLLAKT